MTVNKGKIYLIPNTIAEESLETIPPQVRNVLPSLRFFLAENVRSARRFLSSLKVFDSIEKLSFEVLDKDTTRADLPRIMSTLHEGHDLGIISEAGCPGIADPGALAIAYAHEHNIIVTPLVGPSSILLALMGSGLSGQQFAFHGYLPVEKKEAAAVVRNLETESRKKSQTQIFIETPYRNNHLAEILITNLHPDTMLTIAVDITGRSERIRTMPVRKWRDTSYSLPKIPAVFLFLA